MISYQTGQKEFTDWVVAETAFNADCLGKCETIMCLGNGYMGIRSATEERYVNEKRDTFVAGTFNKADDTEVTELPNCADILAIELRLNGYRLDLNRIKPVDYIRQLNLKTGELIRNFVWGNEETGLFAFESKRFVSLDDLHLIGQRISIRPLTKKAQLSILSGIDAQQSNSGVQHFMDGDKRLYDKKCLQLIQTTIQTKIDFIHNLVHNFLLNGKAYPVGGRVIIDRRRILYSYTIDLEMHDELVIEKFSTIHTSRDREWLETEFILDSIREKTWQELVKKSGKGYDALFAESAKAWWDKVWEKTNITIRSKNAFDQLAIRFAQYHLTVMTPAHDNRMNIGAKGLSGEGYKGHTFWDTEIFILPYFTWNYPEIARSLLEYRYLSLPGAHKKAKENGYEGAMFPWESAWLDDGETTPVWGAADIITGKPTKIWSGFIEQHITSDIVFAVWQYYKITKDQDFMDRYGYEIILDAAKFWASRLEWDDDRQEYCINNVVGPDEYKEHANNNAFTNYTAYWTIQKAIEYHDELKLIKPELYIRLDKKLDLIRAYAIWNERVGKIYLPAPNKDGVLPQDDSYLSKKNIDLTKYKNQEQVGEIFKDYNLTQVNEIQVSKQADVLLLFYLLEDLFEKEIKKASWNYYEPRTLHDSSLSLSTHSVLASDLGSRELAYEMFQKAAKIDLGPNMLSSDHGIHAASLGGIWQCIINGFGGVRMLHGAIRINPHLPKEWDKLTFTVMWQGDKLMIEIDRNSVKISNLTGRNSKLPIEVVNQDYVLENQLMVSLS